jgi:hypothetical protein
MSEEYSGLPTDSDGMEEDDDDGRAGGSWSSSSRSACCTWSATAAAATDVVDSPTSISPLSHPMNTPICDDRQSGRSFDAMHHKAVR